VELDGSESHGTWRTAVNSLSNFLRSHYTRTVYLSVNLNDFASDKSSTQAMANISGNKQSLGILYSAAQPFTPRDIFATYMASDCNSFSCTDLCST
jgi:hypothetical protein